MYRILLILILALASCKAPYSRTTSKHGDVVEGPVMEIPGMERSRQLRVYLPPGYESSEDRYPVLYMQDAQNLFDERTAYAGEWRVDEILDSLALETGLRLIVVGIDNGGQERIHEMNPFEHPEYGLGKGEEFVEFIADYVKPQIDSLYRTMPDREHTGIMGSSLGGLISHYAILQYHDRFSKAGLFSPSYWFGERIYELTEEDPFPGDSKIFMLVGEKEDDMVEGAEKMYELLVESGHPDENLVLEIDPLGEHNEDFWGKHFGKAVKWLYGDE